MSAETDLSCHACGARNPAGAVRCWVCGEPVVAAASPEPGPRVPPALPPRRVQHRWREVEAERAPGGVGWVVAVVVLVALFMTAPGLAILLAACGLPILAAYGPRTGLAGCLLTGAMSCGIVVASVVAWFLTCAALGGGDFNQAGVTGGLLVGIGVFIGLTAVAVMGTRKQLHRRRARKREVA